MVNDDKDLEIWQLKAVLLQTQQALPTTRQRGAGQPARIRQGGRHRLRQSMI